MASSTSHSFLHRNNTKVRNKQACVLREGGGGQQSRSKTAQNMKKCHKGNKKNDMHHIKVWHVFPVRKIKSTNKGVTMKEKFFIFLPFGFYSAEQGHYT